MKTALLAVPFMLAAAAAADSVPSVTVEGRTFPFAFEDATLSEAVRGRIASDVAALWEDQTGSVVQSGADGGEWQLWPAAWLDGAWKLLPPE